MTLKETPASAGIILAIRERKILHQIIREGRLPQLDDLLEGAPFFADSIERDIQSWCDSVPLLGFWRRDEGGKIASSKAPPELLNAVSVLRDTCQRMALEAVRVMLEALGHEDRWRMRVYQSCLQDGHQREAEEARRALALRIAGDGLFGAARLEGLWLHAVASGLFVRSAGSMPQYLAAGLKTITRSSGLLEQVQAAEASIDAADKRAAEAGSPSTFEEIAAAAERFEAGEEDWQEAIEETRAAEPRGVIVVPELQKKSGSNAKKEMAQSWEGLAGEPLPIVQRGDIAEQRRRLVEQWPHAKDVIDIVLGDLASRTDVRFRPTIFVGSKGSGKSSLAVAIAEAVGLPNVLYSMAGVSDSSLIGTSAQWSNARESIPLQLIKNSKFASVAMVWDEIEKADPSRHNGSALEALLPMLEVEQARSFFDLALEVKVDLSHVTHFATANDVSELSAPLRDRFRILHVPEPTWDHLGTLTRQIVDRIAQERDIDPRWFSPLAEDEMDLVRASWPGGSIRKLTRIIRTVLDGREAQMGRC